MSVTPEQVGTEDLDQLFRDMLRNESPGIGEWCGPVADKLATAIIGQAVRRNIPVKQLIGKVTVVWQQHFHQFDPHPTFDGQKTIQDYYMTELACAFARQLVLLSKDQGPEGKGVDTATTAGEVQAVVGKRG